MHYLLQGIIIGLGLNILLGPIFIMITQTAIDKGSRAGLALAGGVWFSDIFISLLCLLFIQRITPYTTNPDFKFYLGLIGGLVIIFIGMRMVYTNNKKGIKPIDRGRDISALNYLTYAGQGFLVNTINPFTAFFWVGVYTTIIFGNNISTSETSFFLSGLIGTIVTFDILKVVLAKKIRKYLNAERMFKLNKYAGIVFIFLGVILMLRSMV